VPGGGGEHLAVCLSYPYEASAEQGADMVILAGDVLLGGWENEQSAQAREVVIPWLWAISKPVCYTMGNDDHVELGYEDERIRSVHARRFDFGPYNIVGYQYSTPFMGGCYEKPEDEIAADLRLMESPSSMTTLSWSPTRRPLGLSTGFLRGPTWDPMPWLNRWHEKGFCATSMDTYITVSVAKPATSTWPPTAAGGQCSSTSPLYPIS
jgi:hypothetical protein